MSDAPLGANQRDTLGVDGGRVRINNPSPAGDLILLQVITSNRYASVLLTPAALRRIRAIIDQRLSELGA